jgi:hypothetical protein
MPQLQQNTASCKQQAHADNLRAQAVILALKLAVNNTSHVNVNMTRHVHVM